MHLDKHFVDLLKIGLSIVGSIHDRVINFSHISK